jgi:hypothetical protein
MTRSVVTFEYPNGVRITIRLSRDLLMKIIDEVRI